jgi:hypothetical protein
MVVLEEFEENSRVPQMVREVPLHGDTIPGREKKDDGTSGGV